MTLEHLAPVVAVAAMIVFFAFSIYYTQSKYHHKLLELQEKRQAIQKTLAVPPTRKQLRAAKKEAGKAKERGAKEATKAAKKKEGNKAAKVAIEARRYQ